MRSLASIRKIAGLMPIKGADRIELARVGGWNVVVKKDDFTVGDLCVYCEIDSVLPDEEQFEFLRDKDFHIKTLKMRGVISQGICFHLTILPGWLKDCGCPYEWTEGEDVTEVIGVTLFDQEEEGIFPHFIPKTSEERIQNFGDELVDMWGIELVVTEKLDGMSVTYYLRDGKFGICSRNCELAAEEENAYTEVGREFGIEDALRNGPLDHIAIQGEIVGPNVHSNKLKLDHVDFFVFHVFDIDKQEFLDWNRTVEIVEAMGLKVVPVVEDFIPFGSIDRNIEPVDIIDQIIKLADGKSLVNPKVRREGVVVRSVDTHLTQFGKLSFKVISNKYLLKRR